MTNWNYEAAARLAARLASSSRSSSWASPAAGAARSSATASAQAAATKTKPSGPQWLSAAAFKTSSSNHPTLVQVARREFSSRAQLWDNLTLPSRRGQQQELSLVANLLPHRATFTAQFLPHGIQLIPKVITVAQQQQQKATGKATGSPDAAAASSARQHAAPAAQPAASTSTKKRSSSTLHDWCAEEEQDSLEEGAASVAGADDAISSSTQAAAPLDHPGKAWRRLQTRRLKLRRRGRKADPLEALEAGAPWPPTP